MIWKADEVEKSFDAAAPRLRSGQASEASAGSRRVLAGVSMEGRAGEWTVIEGPSGVGKTTFLHILAGILRPDRGRVYWDDLAIFDLDSSELDIQRRRRVGLVFQHHHLLPDLSVEENIALPLNLLGDRNASARARELLAILGLADRAADPVTVLSGGERQRVAVARALAHKPDIIIADEPTGELDRETADKVIELLIHASENERAAVVLATHDPSIAAQARKRVEVHEIKLGR